MTWSSTSLPRAWRPMSRPCCTSSSTGSCRRASAFRPPRWSTRAGWPSGTCPCTRWSARTVQQRDRWLLNQTAARAGQVRHLLDDGAADVDSAETSIGYRLRQRHLGLVAWIPEPTRGGEGLARLDRLPAAITEAVGCRRPLFVPCDQGVAWSWLPLETRTVVSWDVLRKIVDDYDPTARVAVGDAVPGLDGFRQTHRQALCAQDVAVFARSGTRVTFFS